MYCVDAAGNQDADNTLIDTDTGDPVSLDSAGYPTESTDPTNAEYNVTLPTPYNLSVRNYGTTTVYWIWQPSASTNAAILHTTSLGNTDSVETAPDASRDMPAPSAFLMNSPTAAITKDPNNPWYDATLFVGNPNGTLYSLDASGTASNAYKYDANGAPIQPTENVNNAAEYSVTDYKQYRLSQNPTIPTVDVNWWFNTGESIGYAPAFDASSNHVYVTTYSSAFNNQGHLYSVDSKLGGYGNQGLGAIGAAASNAPGSFNYNVNPVSYWSFPDKYNGVVPTGLTNHVYNKLITGLALPLGDMAGSPNVETITSDGVTRVLVCANDPGPPSQAMNTGFGRVYSVNEDGTFNWAYPATNQAAANYTIGPDSVGETDLAAYTAIYNQGSYTNNALDSSGSSDGTLTENDFTTEATSDNLFVSSSVATAVINFPTTALTSVSTANAAKLISQAVPMAYVGTLGGHLLALDLNGGLTVDPQNQDVGEHLVSDTTVGQSAPIYSTPAILPAATGTGLNVGGTIYLNAGDPALYELEALPVTTDDGTTTGLPVEEQYFVYNTLGAVSSPSLSAFDTSVFINASATTNGTGNVQTQGGDVEFVYTGTDSGFCFGLTPNATTGNPGGGGTGYFNPGAYIPGGNLPPPTANTSAPNKFIVVRLTNSTNKNDYSQSYGSDVAALYDWGQTAYIQVYGVYQPGPITGSKTSVTPPYSVELTYSLSGGGKQTGGSQTVMVANSGNVTVQKAANVPATVTNLFNDSNQIYVATFPITIGESTAFLPGTRRSLRNLTLTYVDASGAQQTIRLNQGSATRFRQANGTSSVIRTPLPATITVLNPLAVTGAGRTLDNKQANFLNMGELGPVGGIGGTNGTNGGFYALPNTVAADLGDLKVAPSSLQEAEVNGNPVINGSSTLVAVGLGDIAHNTAGDSSLGSTGDPDKYSTTTLPNDPHKGVNVDSTDYSYGNSLFLVTDRSALGTTGQSISDVYMSNDSDSQLAWNDNSGQEGPASVINPLSWDTLPVDQHQNPTGNPSPDYPNIPASNLSATLIARTQATDTAASNPQGVSATITNSGGTLVPASPGSGTVAGDPTGTRTVYPMAAIVKVAVPKYTAANLEVCTDQPITTGLTEIPHTNSLDPALDVPEGYYSKTRVYIDLGSSDNHRFDPNTSAYRDVAVMIGVPVDMGMSIDQPTVDLGTVTAGFADQTGNPWEPYKRTEGALANPTDAEQSTEIFSQYYQPITIRNNGNVNLMNVHVDSDVYLDPVSTSDQSGPSYVRLTSDQTETPYQVASALNPSNWTDSLSFIPSIDNSNNLLLNDAADTNGNLLLRSSLDTDVYLPNALEQDLNDNTGSSHSKYTNATLHKARPGDGSSTTLTVPDEPHDTGNPAYVSLTKTDSTLPSVPYYGKPVVGIAVPLGTPVGTYSGTIRTYEGSDPYKASDPTESANSGYSGTYTGPHYKKAKADQQSGSVTDDYYTAFYVNNSTNIPEQYYSDPGTTLKIAVRESRFTDGPPLVGAVTGSTSGDAPYLALPSGDPSSVNNSAGAPLPTSDVQPFVFSVPGTGDKNLFNMGLLFVSNRYAVGNTKNANANSFDLFSSQIGGSSTSASALTAPSGSGTWWTLPANLTQFTTPTTNSALASQVSSPFVLSLDSDDTAAFFILRNTNAASTSVNLAAVSPTAAPVYTVYEALYSAGSNPPLDLTKAVPLYSSSDPLFGVHAVAMRDTGGTGQIVVMWQARVRGRSRIEYIAETPANGVMLAQSTGTVVPQELPVSTSLVDVQNPAPVLRYIATSTSDVGTAVSATTANALDVAYSGSLQDGTTDIYNSRYYLAPKSGTTSPTLTRIAVVPQTASTTAAPFITSALTLTRSGTDTGLFYAREVDWAANIGAISLGYSASANSNSAFLTGTLPNSTTPRPYTFDKASGQIVYPGVILPWLTNGTVTGTGTVYVNPGLGTVRFSVPPTDPTTVITATVVPLSDRITYNSRTNSEPVAFLDDAIEPAIATLSNSVATPPSSMATQSVNVSREWFIYRKSGSATGATAATNNTLYYDTRRLTANLAKFNGSGTTSFATTKGTIGTGTTQYTALPSTFDVKVTTDPGYGGLTEVTNLVDVDAARARIYFPSTMEGMYAQVTYVDQAGTTQSDIGSAAAPLQIEWQDEPYVNAQTPSVMASGEHVLPIAAAANESNPSAFLDPTSGLNTNGVYVPHRVWVFWSSTRNAAQQQYANGLGSTGSDLYYESIDPSFEPNLP